MTDARPGSFATTLLVRDTCLCLHVQRAARALARWFDRALQPFALTNGQFSLLMALNRLVPARMGPLAELLAMERSTLTAALKPLERRGLVRIEPDAGDRRGRLLVLTSDGWRGWPRRFRCGCSFTQSLKVPPIRSISASCEAISAPCFRPGPHLAAREPAFRFGGAAGRARRD